MRLIIKYNDENARKHVRSFQVDKIVNSSDNFPSSAKDILKTYPDAEVYIQTELNI